MQTLYKTRWHGNRLQIIYNTNQYTGGRMASLTIKMTNRTADKLNLPGKSKYPINPDILETIGNPVTYAKKILEHHTNQIQYRRQTQLTKQLSLFP